MLFLFWYIAMYLIKYIYIIFISVLLADSNFRIVLYLSKILGGCFPLGICCAAGQGGEARLVNYGNTMEVSELGIYLFIFLAKLCDFWECEPVNVFPVLRFRFAFIAVVVFGTVKMQHGQTSWFLWQLLDKKHLTPHTADTAFMYYTAKDHSVLSP